MLLFIHLWGSIFLFVIIKKKNYILFTGACLSMPFFFFFALTLSLIHTSYFIFSHIWIPRSFTLLASYAFLNPKWWQYYPNKFSSNVDAIVITVYVQNIFHDIFVLVDFSFSMLRCLSIVRWFVSVFFNIILGWFSQNVILCTYRRRFIVVFGFAAIAVIYLLTDTFASMFILLFLFFMLCWLLLLMLSINSIEIAISFIRSTYWRLRRRCWFNRSNSNKCHKTTTKN